MKWATQPAFNRLYIFNAHGKKLLKLILSDQKSGDKVPRNAQIKIIHYGLRKAVVWEDTPTDPKVIRMSGLNGFEFTYHGPGADGQLPKVHVIKTSRGRKHYKDVLNSVLPLDHDLQRLVPLFSIRPGYDVDTQRQDKVNNKSHCFQCLHAEPTQIDLYLSSADIDPEGIINSHYGTALFFTFDHLSKQKRGVLIPADMLMPITGYTMGKYSVWVRCIRSTYRGRPLIELVQNADYYEKFANRKVAWHTVDGQMQWSTIVQEAMDASRSLQDKTP